MTTQAAPAKRAEAKKNAKRSTPATQMTPMQRMASKMWAPLVLMGAMLVIIGFVIAAITSGDVAAYYTASKAIREAAGTGSFLATTAAGFHAVKIWVPALIFLGMGMLLGGITFIVATILGNLRVAGARVQEALGVEPKVLKKLWMAHLFPHLMMMGTMLLLFGMGVAIWLSGVANDYWNHSIATELNVAQAGDPLLRSLGTIEAVSKWLTALKPFGIGFLLAGISLALATIIKVLRFQADRLAELVGSGDGARR